MEGFQVTKANEPQSVKMSRNHKIAGDGRFASVQCK